MVASLQKKITLEEKESENLTAIVADLREQLGHDTSRADSNYNWARTGGITTGLMALLALYMGLKRRVSGRSN